MQQRGKYSGDIYLEPEELIEQAMKKNLDGVCITEHSYLLDSWVIEKIKFPKDFYVFRQVSRAFTEFKNPVHTIDELKEEIKKENCIGMIR